MFSEEIRRNRTQIGNSGSGSLVNCTTKSPKGHSGGKPRNVVNQQSYNKAVCTGKALISQVVQLVEILFPLTALKQREIAGLKDSIKRKFYSIFTKA